MKIKLVLLLLLSFFIFQDYSLALAADNIGGTGSNGFTTNIYEEVTKIENEEGGQLFKPNLGTYINVLLRVASIIGAIGTLAFLILGGVEWVTSGGDKSKLESAKGKITSAIIGLLILAAVWAIWTIVLRVFGIDKVPGLDIQSDCGLCLSNCQKSSLPDNCLIRCRDICN
jgi:hypothetical protein